MYIIYAILAKNKPRTIYLFSSLLFVLCKKGSHLVKNVYSYTEGTIPQTAERTALLKKKVS